MIIILRIFQKSKFYLYFVDGLDVDDHESWNEEIQLEDDVMHDGIWSKMGFVLNSYFKQYFGFPIYFKIILLGMDFLFNVRFPIHQEMVWCCLWK